MSTGRTSGAEPLMKAGFDTLAAADSQPENGYFECVDEMNVIVALIYGGLDGMRPGVSDTAEFGDYVVGALDQRGQPRRDDRDPRGHPLGRLHPALGERVEQRFHRIREHALRAARALVEEVGARLRSRMAWMEGDA
jgi:ketol-acid reductoisomerase